MTQVKVDALEHLARRRQKVPYNGYSSIGDFHDSAYECIHVSPYTKSARNVDSSVFVMLQDWLSESAISRKLNPSIVEFGQNPQLQTNRVLKQYLKGHFSLELVEVFATNLFPYIKPGGMSTRIHRPALRHAAVDFGIPQIDIVQPRLVIALGLEVYNATAYALRLDQASTIGRAINNPLQYNDARIWCQAHTGYWGQLNRSSVNRTQLERDWSQMAEWYKSVA